MKWYQHFISEEGLKKVTQATLQAEKKTSGEIVPVVIGRSSTIGHVPLTLFLILILMYWLLGEFYLWETVSFDHNLLHGLALVSTYILSRTLCRWRFLQRILTPKADQLDQVMARAQLEFYQSQIKATEGSTGVLILVSLLEHQAVVLADRAINEKLTPETWQNVVDLIASATKKGDLAGGLVAGIQRCGELLASHFPIQPGDENELPNQLILKEF